MEEKDILNESSETIDESKIERDLEEKVGIPADYSTITAKILLNS